MKVIITAIERAQVISEPLKIQMHFEMYSRSRAQMSAGFLVRRACGLEVEEPT